MHGGNSPPWSLSNSSGVTSAKVCRWSFAALLIKAEAGPSFCRTSVDRSLEVGGPGHIAAQEQRRVPRRAGQRLCQRLAGVLVEIEEGDLGAVVGEGLDELLANAAGAAGDQDDAIPENSRIL